VHEYLAAGKSVVATAMPELLPYSHVLHIADDDEDFISKVGQAIKNNTSDAIESRVAVARENTWDRRVEDMYQVLESFLLKSTPKKTPVSSKLLGEDSMNQPVIEQPILEEGRQTE
jgi:hypothetical protein